MAKVKLLKGNTPDIISANVNSLKSSGLSHAHATHLSMKHANKKLSSKVKNITSKVTKKVKGIKIIGGGYDA